MKPLQAFDASTIAGVFTDIDDTLTTEGAITPDALQALADLKAAGLVKTAKMPSTMAGERAQADKARRETAWRMAVAGACLDAARTAGQPYREALIGRVRALGYAGEIEILATPGRD